MRLPNRAERKAYNKAHKTHYTLQDFALMYAVNGIQKGEDISWLKPYLPTDMISHKDNWDLFPDGTKVKLSYEGITSRPPRYLSLEFKDWVEKNKEEEFTVFRDPEDKDRKGLVAVRYVDSAKDTEQSKTWLFDMYSDLLVWSPEDNDYVNPQRVEDRENEIANVKQSLAVCDSLDVTVEEKEYNRIEEIRKILKKHEDGVKKIADPIEWQNMDSELQDIIEKMTTLPEEEIPAEEEKIEEQPEETVEAPAEVVAEENTTQGGEE